MLLVIQLNPGFMVYCAWTLQITFRSLTGKKFALNLKTEEDETISVISVTYIDDPSLFFSWSLGYLHLVSVICTM